MLVACSIERGRETTSNSSPGTKNQKNEEKYFQAKRGNWNFTRKMNLSETDRRGEGVRNEKEFYYEIRFISIEDWKRKSKLEN
jgi:hypothetical protein